MHFSVFFHNTIHKHSNLDILNIKSCVGFHIQNNLSAPQFPIFSQIAFKSSFFFLSSTP